MIARIIQSYLADDDDIRDIVGTRIFASRAPREAKGPLLILRQSNVRRSYHLQNEVTYKQSSVQIDAYDATDSAAEYLAEQVRNRLSGVVNASVEWIDAGGTTQTTNVQYATAGPPEGHFPEPPGDGSDKWNRRYTVTYEVGTDQTAPTHT